MPDAHAARASAPELSAAMLEQARRLDASDPLREFAREFALPRNADGTPLVYLCGHSLGPLPLAARDLVAQELDDWSRLAVAGHESARRPWIDYAERLRPGLEELAGARPGEVVAMNSLTINLHLMLASFYRPAGRRTKILLESGAFPSDRHAVASQIAWHGLDPHSHLIELGPSPGSALIEPRAIEETLRTRGEEIAVVLWPGVQYLTGQAFDLAAVASAARRAGAIAGFDLAHAIGNLPLDLHDAEADFAVWCGYKYLNGGPGAIAGCFVHERHGADRRLPRLAGWWGHEAATRFRMGPEFRPAAGAEGWQVSNPPILSSAPLIASLEIFRRAGIERLRAKSIALTRFLESVLEPLPITLVTPGEAGGRGAQLSIRIGGSAERGRDVLRALRSGGLVCDWREPDIIRVAPAPLYNRFEDAMRFAERLSQALRAVP
jgi:kynureninase